MGLPTNWISETILGQTQRTISREVTLEGRGGFKNEPAKVILCPAAADTGIRFKRAGNNDVVPATPEYLLPREQALYKTTSLLSGNLEYQTVEHLLSAIYGLGIDNILVVTEVNGLLPFFDGSSEEFTRSILRIGIKQQNGEKRLLTVKEQREFRVDGEDGYLRISYPPSPGVLDINANIIYDDPIGIQECKYVHDSYLYCLEIARARTFQHKFFTNTQTTRKKFAGFLKTEFRYVDSNTIIYNKKRFLTHLRWKNECVRHKVLDFLGDISLIGTSIAASVDLHKTGHAFNHEFVNAVWEERRP